MESETISYELYVTGRLDEFQPHLAGKLEQNGISSVREALYGQDNIYLISSFDRGTEYLTELYDGVTCEQVDTIRQFKVYRLVKEAGK